MKRKSIVEWCVEESSNLLSEWDYQHNTGIDIDSVSYGSTKKYWWICSKGHSYQATPNSRTGASHTGCPICAGKLIVSGINDLQSRHPSIVDYWDYDKNFPIGPDGVAPNSNKKYWWKCNQQHSFMATPYSIGEKFSTYCPYCSNKKVLIGYNDLATTHPNLIKEWDYLKNKIGPCDVTFGNSSKVWWKCEHGHNYQASISSRAGKQQTGCPYCAGLIAITGENDLRTCYPDIAKQWDYNKNSNADILSVSQKSNKLFWWICEKGHSYKSAVSDRVNGRGCPICANKKILVGYNDLETVTPSLASEWHPVLNDSLTPKDVTFGSNKKVWWRCTKGHEWCATVSSRSRGNNCPYCAKENQTSIPEKALLFYIRKLCSEVVTNAKLDWLGNMEMDVYIPSLNIGVEFDGEHWHQNINNDIRKDETCFNNGILLIRIRESGCPDYNSSSIKINVPKITSANIENICQYVFKELGKYIEGAEKIDIDLDRDYDCILYSIVTGRKDRSLQVVNPTLAKEWSVTKNGVVTPNMVMPNSQKKFWWECSNGHSWRASVQSRNMGNGCPYCSGKKVIAGVTDLRTTHPHICNQWDYQKNGDLYPDNVTAGSNRRVWWKCEKGHSWQSIISSRTRSNISECPFCSNQRVWVGYNDLNTTNPELLFEWNYEKNTLKPQDLTAGSEKKVWWRCVNGHEYLATVRSRAKLHTGCVKCYHQLRSMGKNKKQ